MTNEFKKIENYLNHKDGFHEEVSKVTVAWHLDHSLKVINKICDSLKTSETSTYRKKFNWMRFLFLTLGYIPRGKGKSPTAVLPPENIKTEDIIAQLAIAKEKISEIPSLENRSNFKHPMLGQMNKKQANRFIAVHTRHHLKIVKDILKQ